MPLGKPPSAEHDPMLLPAVPLPALPASCAVAEPPLPPVFDDPPLPPVPPAFDPAVEDYLRPLFQQHYTMSFENYPVSPERVHGLEIVR